MGDSLKRPLCGLAALACLQLLLPDGPARAVLQFAVNTGAAVAVHVGLRRYRPEQPLGWQVLAVALWVLAVSNVGWGLREAGGGEWASWLEAAPKLAAYLTLLLAAVAFLAVRRPGHARDGLLDAGIVLAAGTLLVAEWWAGGGLTPTWPQMLAVAASLLMAATVTVGVRLALTKGHPMSAMLLVSAAVLALTGNIARAVLEHPAPHAWHPLWVIGSGLIAGAALHPSMTVLGRAETAPEPEVSRNRMVVLGAALLASPTVLALRGLRQGEEGWGLAAGAGLLTVLVLWRLGRLVTARERDRQALVLRDRRLQSLLRHAPDVVLVTDGNGSLTYMSPAAGRLLGLDPNHCAGMNAVDLVHPEDLSLLTCAFRDLGDDDAGVLSFDLRLQHADGGVRWVEAKLSDLREEPAVAGFVVNIREVTERKALEAKLVHQALHDPLTALPNRVLFHRRVEEALAAGNGHPRLLAVLFLDIDDFKMVNDSLGHSVGDELLQEVAVRLGGCLRSAALAARLGGDEFAVLLADTPSIQAAVQLARGLVEQIAQPLALHGLTLTMQACVGIAFASEGASAASLLRDADVAMYQAKNQGKGQVALFDMAQQNGALRRLSLRAGLANALAGHELFLRYQPIVELHSGCAVGTEALLRWQHPQRGALLPDEFLAVAEEMRLMRPLGRWVLEQACLHAQACHARFPDQPLSVSVNLSSTQLNDGAVVEDVERALEISGLPPECLLLELTESTLLRDTETAAGAVHRLKALGIRLAVDDFGTGYCSLSYLRRLPVDVLKIDRSFVADLGSDVRQAKLTEGIVQMARTLDMEIVAEGIESVRQLAHLQRLGCHLGQGYLFAHPLAPEDLDDLLETRHGECLPASST